MDSASQYEVRRKSFKSVPSKARSVQRKAKDSPKVSNAFIIDVCSSKRQGSSPLPIIYHEPSEEELMKWLATESGYIQGFFTFDGRPFDLEDYQERWVDDDSQFRWAGKSRRVGLSLAESAKRTAKAMLINTNSNTTVISYTLEEALGKIDYARALYDAVPTQWKKRKIRDRRQSLEFIDKETGTIAKLLSHAQRAPRGGGGSVILDEFAHFQWPFKILEAALACILTGGGDITMISTPFGEGDPFHEVGTNLGKYTSYSRHWIFWWDCSWLCTNVPLARKLAPKLTTEERVHRFGTALLKKVFESYVDVTSFQQEMEILFVASSYKYFPIELIKSCLFPFTSKQWFDIKSGNVTVFDPNAFDTVEDAGVDLGSSTVNVVNRRVEVVDGHSSFPIVNSYANDKEVNFYKCNKLAELSMMVQRGIVNPFLLAGYDVGRTTHASDLRMLEEVRTADGSVVQIERYSEIFENMPIPDQEAFLIQLMNMFPLMRLAIDARGIGRGTAERLQRLFRNRIIPVIFTAEWKAEATKEFKARLEKQAIAIAEDRLTIEHINSIRRSVSLNMVELFAADKNVKHHGDCYWALAMAAQLGTPVADIRGRMSLDTRGKVFGSLRFQKTKQQIYQMMNAMSGGDSRVVPGGRSVRLATPGEVRRFSGLAEPEGVAGLPSPMAVL